MDTSSTTEVWHEPFIYPKSRPLSAGIAPSHRLRLLLHARTSYLTRIRLEQEGIPFLRRQHVGRGHSTLRGCHWSCSLSLVLGVLPVSVLSIVGACLGRSWGELGGGSRRFNEKHLLNTCDLNAVTILNIVLLPQPKVISHEFKSPILSSGEFGDTDTRLDCLFSATRLLERCEPHKKL